MAEIRPELIVLIEDEIEAQKLIVTWSKVYVDYGEQLDGTTPAELDAVHPFTEAWARVSGVDVDDVEKWAPVLFLNGLLLDNGISSDTAMGYVKSRIIADIPRVTP